MDMTDTTVQDFCREHIYQYDHAEDFYAETLPQAALAFTTVDQLIRAVDASGSHWFDTDTRRFFNSRIAPQLIGSRFFVSSERMGSGYPRIYTVRWVAAGNHQLPIYNFETSFLFLRQAYAFAKKAHKVIPFPTVEPECDGCDQDPWTSSVHYGTCPLAP